MEIKKTDPYSGKEHIHKKVDFLSLVLDQIFLICKADKHFSVKKRIDEVELEIEVLKKKVSKQDSLLNQAEKISTEINEKQSSLESKNFKIRVDLLEALGSEL